MDELKNIRLCDVMSMRLFARDSLIFSGAFEHLTWLFVDSVFNIHASYEYYETHEFGLELNQNELQEFLKRVADGIAENRADEDTFPSGIIHGFSPELRAVEILISKATVAGNRYQSPVFTLETGRRVFAHQVYAVCAIMKIDDAMSATIKNDLPITATLTLEADRFLRESDDARDDYTFGIQKPDDSKVISYAASVAGKRRGAKFDHVRDYAIKLAMERLPGTPNPWRDKTHCIAEIWPEVLRFAKERGVTLSEDRITKTLGEWLGPAHEFKQPK